MRVVERFVDDELEANIAVARTLSRYWKRHDGLLHDPRFVFVTNGDDGAGNCFANVLRAAIEELIRIWRDESAVDATHARRDKPEWGNQIVRYTNNEPESLSFAAGQAARILLKERKIKPVNLYLPESIGEATGARKAMAGQAENITGLHLGKVALITGGSAGIGGAVARLLAIAGAKVMMVARRDSELAAARERIVGELEDIGFSGVERRVRTLADIDVSDVAGLQKAVDETVKAFGRIDYLINNAGVSGAEEMAVDMDIEAWRHTAARQPHLQLCADAHGRADDAGPGLGLYPQCFELLRRREVPRRQLPQPHRLCRVKGRPAGDGGIAGAAPRA